MSQNIDQDHKGTEYKLRESHIMKHTRRALGQPNINNIDYL